MARPVTTKRTKSFRMADDVVPQPSCHDEDRSFHEETGSIAAQLGTSPDARIALARGTGLPLAGNGRRGIVRPVNEQEGTISERLAAVRARIDAAAIQSGRSPGSVRLVAVSKTKPPEAIREAYASGQRDFGENYVQEMALKAAALADLSELRLHFIGALQRNKAKQAASVAAVIHTVDREELATELDRRAGALGRTLDVLLEVNVGGEASKAGCAPEAVPALLEAARRAEHLRVVGLMAIPPYLDDPEAVRPFFARLRELRDTLEAPALLPELSMGMSHDFHVAIAEGATIVRVGTAIFGGR